MGSKNEAIADWVEADRLVANPWNPNVMDDETFAKEVESIKRYGFIDPITVRMLIVAGQPIYQIIDGEHRWRAGRQLGMTEFPVVKIDVTDQEAEELTIVLNELRGKPDEAKLSTLVRRLTERRDAQELAMVMPYTAERLKTMATGIGSIDWDALRDRRDKLKKDPSRWVERVYRMPAEVSQVVDDALTKVKDREGLEYEWQALEAIAADVLGSP